MRRIAFATVFSLGFIFALLVNWNARIGFQSELAAYRADALSETQHTADVYQSLLGKIERSLKTIARLPGVRAIKSYAASGTAMDHGGVDFETNARYTVQEIYNALVSEINVSELYLVPLDLDPDGDDPTGRLPQEPIATFDKFIRGTPSDSQQKQGVDQAKNTLEEIEIYEYRLMRKQLDWMREHYPTERVIRNIKYPMISGEPVITCDNTGIDINDPNDDDRTGLVFSVPFYDQSGNLGGCVSAVILVHTLSQQLSSGNMAIINNANKIIAPTNIIGQFQDSQRSGFVTTKDPRLLYSQIISIPTSDRSGDWAVWSGFSDDAFWARSGVNAIRQARNIGFFATGTMVFGATVALSLLFRSQRRLSLMNAGLEGAVADRTRELQQSREEVSRSFASLQSIATELQHQQNALDVHAVVSVADIRGNIIEVNDKFCALSGYSREELIGQNHRVLNSGEHDKEFFRILWKTISSGNVWSGEVKNLNKNGEPYWVSATIVPFKDDKGRVTKYVAMRTDITELKARGEYLKKSNDMLADSLDREQDASLELAEAMEKLDELASTDKLTGLPNRSVFLDRLEQTMLHSSRSGTKFAVLFFDFDRFKVVNDSLGHDVGDALLCDIAAIFNAELRTSDTAARFGGDEFVVLLTDLKTWADADLKAKRLLRAFAKPHRLEDHVVVSTASIGLVTNEQEYSSPGDMIRDADAAMYNAKANGRGMVVQFDQEMHNEVLERHSLETDLRKAVDDMQLAVVYQPIVHLSSGETRGAEVLMRWNHPARGPVSPATFIPIAEETGLIIAMGQWVLEQACTQYREWKTKGIVKDGFSLSVNVSKRQLLDENFQRKITECIESFQISPGELKLEITETTIVENRSTAVTDALCELRKLGVPVVMDDFGTGHSSLSGLHELPIDELKIDQSFIRQADGNRKLIAITASIVGLAEHLSLRTVGEGIETADDLSILQTIDCEFGQGYLFSKPVDAAEFEKYLFDDHPHTLPSLQA